MIELSIVNIKVNIKKKLEYLEKNFAIIIKIDTKLLSMEKQSIYVKNILLKKKIY